MKTTRAAALALAAIALGCGDTDVPRQETLPRSWTLTVAVTGGPQTPTEAAALAASQAPTVNGHPVDVVFLETPPCSEPADDVAEDVHDLASQPGFLGLVHNGCEYHLTAFADAVSDPDRPLVLTQPPSTHRQPFPNTYALQTADAELAAATAAFFHDHGRRRLLILNDDHRQPLAAALSRAWSNRPGTTETRRTLDLSRQGLADVVGAAHAFGPDAVFLASDEDAGRRLLEAFAAYGCSRPPAACRRRMRPFTLLLTQEALTDALLQDPHSRSTHFVGRTQNRSAGANSVTGQRLQDAARDLGLDPADTGWQYVYDAVSILVHAFNDSARPHPTKTLARPDDALHALDSLFTDGLSGAIDCRADGDCSTQSIHVYYQPASNPYNRVQDLRPVYEQP